MLVPYEDRVTGVDLTDDELQVARGSPITDGDGTRRATLLLEPGTEATATLPDGTEKDLGDRLNIRATEFTIGANGPAAMPGELPPTSAYTYAVEYSVDEASKDQAVNVEFDKPVVTYVDNIVGFKAGTPVPMGYYDREQAQWIAAPDGIVIKILGEPNGRAQLDVDRRRRRRHRSSRARHRRRRAGQARRPLRARQEPVAGRDHALHAVGLQLALRPARRRRRPGPGWPRRRRPRRRRPVPPGRLDHPLRGPGARRAGHDRRHAVPARLPVRPRPRPPHRRRARDPADAARTRPPRSTRVDLTIEVAGRTITRSFNRAPEPQDTFIFDGLDAYGRAVQGRQKVDVKIDYVYPAVYRSPGSFSSSFAAIGGNVLSANRTRQEITVSQNWSGVVGGLTAPPSALAGWSIDVHHTYDPIGRTLYLGDGTKRSAEGQNFDVISTTKSGLAFPEGLAPRRDGALFVADSRAHVVRRIAPGGATTMVAGTGDAPGSPATAARRPRPRSITPATWRSARTGRSSSPTRATTASAGSARRRDHDARRHRRRAATRATAARPRPPCSTSPPTSPSTPAAPPTSSTAPTTRSAGSARTGSSPRWPATARRASAATAAWPPGPACARRATSRCARDGSVFVADGGNHRVRRIDPDGTIETVAGNGADATRATAGPRSTRASTRRRRSCRCATAAC